MADQNRQYNKGGQGGQNDVMKELTKKVSEIGALTPGDIDAIAERAAKYWSDVDTNGRPGRNGVKTNQIRNIYGYISVSRNMFKSMKRQEKGHTMEEVKNTLIFLKPRLAYAAGRDNKIKDKQIDQFFRAAINSLERCEKARLESALDSFFKLSEAIVAYHRYYVG